MDGSTCEAVATGSRLVAADDPVLTERCPVVPGGSPKEIATIAAFAIGALREEIALHDVVAGLAANQIGIPLRVFVMKAKDGILPMINPRLFEVATSGGRAQDRAERPLQPGLIINGFMRKYGADAWVWSTEECLTMPGYRAKVPRRRRVWVAFIAENGRRVATILDGGASVIAQHEIDHLNGLLLTPHPGALRGVEASDEPGEGARGGEGPADEDGSAGR
ncbi:MAG: peptide deformylase [Steroidobacteraceae bacterium]